MRVETKILENLLYNEEYCRKVVPHLKLEYFTDRLDKAIGKVIIDFFMEYNKLPDVDIVKIELDKADVTDKELHEAYSVVDEFKKDSSPIEYKLQLTEKFCKDKAIYNAILQSISIIEGKDKVHTQEVLPKLLQDALGVSFDTNVGHDYTEDAEARFEFYRRIEERIAFDIDLLNKITAGGLPRKSLNIILAGVNVGKSLVMCHVAASALKQGNNVLYITLELAEERVGERIDANLMNITLDELKIVDKEVFDKRMDKIRNKTNGKLIIKEYPTASAHSGHFRALLEELKTKKNFIPDMVIIDYLNICASARMKMGAAVNSYTYIKSIAEELRGLAVEYNIPILSATQVNRTGFSSSDIEMTDTSESFGLPATADFMIAVIRTEELDELNQIMVKQLKNRYADPSKYKRFVVGVERSKMKLYDVENCAQDLCDSGVTEPQEDQWAVNRKTKTKEFNGFKY